MGKPCRTKFTLPSGDTFIIDLDSSLRMTEHFTIAELANWSNDEEVKFIITPESLEFMQRIESFRQWYGLPMKCNCNYRSVKFNASTQDAIKSSEHIKALAFDWGITTHTSKQRNNVKNRIFKQARSYGCGCHVIYYKWGYHIDFAGKSCQLLDYR